MITGRVTPDGREAVISLDVRGARDRGERSYRRIEAVIDTGFTGYLTLPADVAASLASRSEVPRGSSSPTAARPFSPSIAGGSSGTEGNFGSP